MACPDQYGKKSKVRQGGARAGAMAMLILLIILPARTQPAEDYQVKWIGSYPLEDGDQKAGLGERVSRLIFGEKPGEAIKPFNVVALNQKEFWILDQGAGAVLEVNNGKGNMIRSMKKGGQNFPSLVGICRSSDGDLLFTDSRLNRIMRDRGDQLINFGDPVLLDQPTGIACNRVTGDIWVVETGAHQVTRFSSEGRLIERTGGRGTGPGLFNFPTFIWIDAEGRIYIVDSMNYRIQILDPDGKFLSSFGESGDATGYMARPKGVACDSQGHIYVADALFHAVQIFDREGRFLYSFGKQGQDNGEFWLPTGLCIDEDDNIYVADSYNTRVQIFQLEKN